ncbi:MAG: serine hydrolase domain-containing protein [Ferruginibacter sp.]
MRNLLLVPLLFLLFSCKKEDAADPVNPPVTPAMYFPPTGSTGWQTTDPASLGWSSTAVNDLYSYLQTKNSKAFIVLKDGKIVLEKYFGTFTADSNWYWASAGKTITGLLVGIAQQEGHLNINDKSSQYLGTGWTSMPLAKENLITVRHQLTMTTGVESDIPNVDCTLPSCLQYRVDAGTRWYYHNATYTLLDKLITNATGSTFNNYFQQKIRNPIGMDGTWLQVDYNNVYFSKARSMARFGLLMLNKGKWNGAAILNDSTYFNAQTNTSQNLNLSYGYLTWLNGKATHMLPTVSAVFNGSIAPNAPADMYAALGKNDQKVYVIPSLRMVVIRMGESADNPNLAVSSFDNELWGKLRPIFGY